MATTNRIHDFVSGLSAKDMAELRTQMEYKQTTSTVPELSVDELLFWDSMCDALRDMNLTVPNAAGRYNMIHAKNGIGRDKYTECAIAMRDYVSHACSTRLDRTHRRAIYVEVLGCLLKWMRRSRWRKDGDVYHISLEPRTICNEIGELPQAVNRCYPGYVKARLLHVIVPRSDDAGRIRIA